MSRIKRGWALTKKSWALLNGHRELIRFPLYGARRDDPAGDRLPRPRPLPARPGPARRRDPAARDRRLRAQRRRLLLQRRPRRLRRHDLPRPGGDRRRRPRGRPQPLRPDLRLGGGLDRDQRGDGPAREPGRDRSAQIAARLVGMAWSLVTFLAVPVIAIEGTGPFETLKRSASIFRERWGQQITGNIAIGAAIFLLGVLPAGHPDRRRDRRSGPRPPSSARCWS